MRTSFNQTLYKLAAHDPRIVLIIGDVNFPNNLVAEYFPNRFFNVGICEQTMISMAAGMATNGLRPVVYTLTPFLLERPFEQIKIDIDEQNLPVILVGFDDYPTYGPTHRPLNPEKTIDLFKNIHGFFPKSSFHTEKALLDAYLLNAPCFIRLQKDGLPYLGVTNVRPHAEAVADSVQAEVGNLP